eukprot:3537135-Prymnesium_polylepis.1
MAPLPQRAPQTHHRPSTCDETAPRPQDHAYPPAPRRRRPKHVERAAVGSERGRRVGSGRVALR